MSVNGNIIVFESFNGYQRFVGGKVHPDDILDGNVGLDQVVRVFLNGENYYMAVEIMDGRYFVITESEERYTDYKTAMDLLEA